MSETERCEDCKCFFATRETLMSKSGLCRRYPPAVISAGAPQESAMIIGAQKVRQMSIPTVCKYPSVHVDGWCNEFKAKDAT